MSRSSLANHGFAPLSREALAQHPQYLPYCTVRDFLSLTSIYGAIQTGTPAVHEHYILPPDRSKPPRNLSNFRFLTIVPDASRKHVGTFKRHQNTVKYPESVQINYETPGGKPFLDGSIVLGLVFKNQLTAVCSGGFAPEGPLITQIQAVGVRSDIPEMHAEISKRNGLHSGIDWAQTLIAGWQAMTSPLRSYVSNDYANKPYWLQSARNNYWIRSMERIQYNRYLELHRKYDGIAQKIGGRFEPSSSNYEIPIISGGHR